MRWLYRELDTRSLDKEGAQIFTDVIAFAEELDDHGSDLGLEDAFLKRAKQKQVRRMVSRITDPTLYCQVCRERGRLSNLETADDGSQVCLRCDWRSGESVE